MELYGAIKFLKMSKNMFSRLIFQHFYQPLVNGEFTYCLKQAEVVSIFKKYEKIDKSNYRPMSILPVILEMYERLMYDQINKYFVQIFSKV